jgi:hypothetical protein
MGSATEMVDLIKRIIREEEEKKDQVITATVQSRHDATDTYDVYIDTDLAADGRQAVMKNIPNESKHIYRPGDHVYIMKVRGQVAQGFIIGAIGSMGLSLNAKVNDLGVQLNSLTSNVSDARMLVAPNMTCEAFKTDEGYFGLRLKWAGKVIPSVAFYLYTNLTVSGTARPNGYITFNTSPSLVSQPPTDTSRIRVTTISDVINTGTTGVLCEFVRANVSPVNNQQFIEFVFKLTSSSTYVMYDNVIVNSLNPQCSRGYAIMGAEYKFIVEPES